MKNKKILFGVVAALSAVGIAVSYVIYKNRNTVEVPEMVDDVVVNDK